MTRQYPTRKGKVLDAFLRAFSDFDQVILVGLMFISTEQIVKTRAALRDDGGVILIGKNSIAKIAIKIISGDHDESHPYYKIQQKYKKKPELAKLLPFVKHKIGFIFSHTNYVEIKPIIEKEVVKMPAKAGVYAPCDIWLRPGPTFQDPGKIGEFQNLNIQVKAIKGSLEIVKDFLLCKKGDMVTETVSHMCRLLNIIPFEYAMELQFVFDKGQIIPQEIIQLTPESILGNFQETVRDLTQTALAANLPNALSVPHMIMNQFKNMLSIGLASGYEFKELKEAQEAKAQAPAEEEKKEQAKEEAKEESEEESEDMDLGGMFD